MKIKVLMLAFFDQIGIFLEYAIFINKFWITLRAEIFAELISAIERSKNSEFRGINFCVLRRCGRFCGTNFRVWSRFGKFRGINFAFRYVDTGQSYFFYFLFLGTYYSSLSSSKNISNALRISTPVSSISHSSSDESSSSPLKLMKKSISSEFFIWEVIVTVISMVDKRVNCVERIECR